MRARMNQRKISEKILLYGALILLLACGIYALTNGKTFSDAERRNLSKLPENISVTEWTFDSDLETYLSDHTAHRRLLVGISNTLQAAAGQGTWLNAWPAGDAVIEPPVENASTLPSGLTRLRRFAEGAGKKCLFLVPPTAGSMLKEGRRLYFAYEEERQALNSIGAEEDVISLNRIFSESSDRVLYRTDHHWTLHGAYLAYTEFCEKTGLQPAALNDFNMTEYAPFYGTTLSRSGMLRFMSDTLQCAEPAYDVLYRIYDDDGALEEYDHLIFPERAFTYDGYAVYMDGNHGHTEILSSAPGAKGTLLVYGDSFALSILPFLSANYERIVMCDVRYAAAKDTAETAPEAELILYIYSADDLCNDTSVKRMRWR